MSQGRTLACLRGRSFWLLAGILVVSFLVRLAFFLEVKDDPTFTVPLWDAAVFDEMARSVARGDGVGYPKAYFFGPLYAYLLGGLYLVSSGSAAAVAFVQHLVGVVVVGLTYALSRTWFGQRASLLAAALLGLAGVQLFYEGKLLMEVWVALLLLGAVLLLARLDLSFQARARASDGTPPPPTHGDSRKARTPLLVRTPGSPGATRVTMLCAGLMIGLAALGRPSVLLLAALALTPLLRVRRTSGLWASRGSSFIGSGSRSGCGGGSGSGSGSRSGGGGVWVLGGLFLLGLIVGPTSALVRNYRTEGVWVPITSSGGFNFYLGNAPDSAGMLEDTKIRVDSSWNGEDSAEEDVGRQLDSAEVSRYWFARTWREVSQARLWWVGHLLDKLQTFFGAKDVPQIEVYSAERGRSRVLTFLPVGLHMLMMLGLAGMVTGLRGFRGRVLLYGALILYAFGVSLFFVTTRYRIVALPYLAVFGGAFLDSLLGAVSRRSVREGLGLLFLGVACWAFTLPARFPGDATKSLYAQSLHDGFRLARAGEFARAEAAYLEAQRLEPDDYEGYLGLGIAYREAGEYDRSLRQLERAMERNHVDAEVPYHLGVTLHKMGLYDGAERALRQSLALAPRRALTHTYLGLVLAAEGRLAEARASLELGRELDPGEAFTHNNLGVLQSMQGDGESALRSFERAVELDPTYTAARRNVARAYLDRGDLTRARRELERVLELDPSDENARSLLQSIR